MCNDDGCQTLLLEVHEQVPQHLRVFVIQRGCRLIQDQQFDVFGECFRDFHQLLLAGTDILDQGMR